MQHSAWSAVVGKQGCMQHSASPRACTSSTPDPQHHTPVSNQQALLGRTPLQTPHFFTPSSHPHALLCIPPPRFLCTTTPPPSCTPCSHPSPAVQNIPVLVSNQQALQEHTRQGGPQAGQDFGYPWTSGLACGHNQLQGGGGSVQQGGVLVRLVGCTWCLLLCR
jgi:hypothetical protein